MRCLEWGYPPKQRVDVCSFLLCVWTSAAEAAPDLTADLIANATSSSRFLRLLSFPVLLVRSVLYTHVYLIMPLLLLTIIAMRLGDTAKSTAAVQCQLPSLVVPSHCRTRRCKVVTALATRWRLALITSALQGARLPLQNMWANQPLWPFRYLVLCSTVCSFVTTTCSLDAPFNLP